MNIVVEKTIGLSTTHLEEIRDVVKRNPSMVERIDTDEEWEFSYIVFDYVEGRFQKNIFRNTD